MRNEGAKTANEGDRAQAGSKKGVKTLCVGLFYFSGFLLSGCL